MVALGLLDARMQPLLSTWTVLPNAGLRIDLVRAGMAHSAQA